MRTLAPSQTFLRVADKFFGRHALFDRELKPGATLLYLYLYAMCGKQDHCWPSQSAMAEACKASERSVQQYLKELVRLEYIRVERQGKHNVYFMLCSERVRNLARAAGMDLTSTIGENSAPIISIKPKILQKIGADSAYDLRSPLSQENNTPLSPLPPSTPGIPPCRSCSPRSPVTRSGSGGIPHQPSSCSSARQAQDEFVQLWQVWPLKQDRYDAYREYAKQLSMGVLPKLDELLGTIDRLKSEDRRWANGYIPNLKFWLRGRRWEDELCSGKFSQEDSANSHNASVPAKPFTESRVVALPELPVHPDKVFFEDLVERCRMAWPEIPQGCLRAGLYLAKSQMVDFAGKMKQLPFFSGVSKPTSLPVSMPALNPQAIACWVRELA